MKRFLRISRRMMSGTLAVALLSSGGIASAQPTAPPPVPPAPGTFPGPPAPVAAPPGPPGTVPLQPGPPGAPPSGPNGQPGNGPNPGYPPNPAYPPNPGYPPNPAYPPNPGDAPNPGYAPPPPGPSRFNFIEGAPIPPGYRVETQPRIGLAVAGWSVFGAVYIPNIITAGFVIDNARSATAAPLFLPGIGPFFAVGTLQADLNRPSVGLGVLLVLDGLVQSAGIAMGIAAFAAPRKVVVRNQYGSVRFAPVATGGELPGFGLSGEF